METEAVTDLVTVEDLTKSYGEVNVLEGVSFTIPDGEVFGILGPNGVGKTTLIKILTGQDSPNTGTVSVLGLTPWEDETQVRHQIGILPEKQSPPSYLTPREFFRYVGMVRGIPDATLEENIDKWAEYLSFEDKLDTLSSNLSRGQQQKVMFAQALLHDPKIVFIDEPVANLDPLMQERVKEFIQDYSDEGNTVVLSTHHIEFASDLCSKILSLTADEAVLLDDNPTADELIQHFEETW